MSKWDDVANSPNSQVVEELRKELSRLQQELRAKDGRIFEQSAAMDKRTTEEITEIMIQRDDAILKNGIYVELQEANKKLGELNAQRGGLMELVQSAPPPPHVTHAIPQPSGMKAIYRLPKAPALTTSVNNMMNTNQMGASVPTQATNPQDEINKKLRDELVEQEARAERNYTKRWGNTSRGYGRLRKVKSPSKALMRTWASLSLSRTRTTLLGSEANMMDQLWARHQVTDRSRGFPDENTKR